MAKIVKETIHAKGIDIGIYTTNFENEFISLTAVSYTHLDVYKRQSVPFPAEQMAERRCAAFLGDLPQYSIRVAGPFDHCPVLSECKGASGQRVPAYVADDRAQLRLLHSGGALGGRHPRHWHAHDSQDLRLCLDGSHRISGNGSQ